MDPQAKTSSRQKGHNSENAYQNKYIYLEY